jgi:arylformamidase
MLDIEHGDVANVSTLSLGSHTGTHMDSPLHFVRGGEGIDRMPLDATMGRARVIEIQDPTSINPEELVPHGIGRGERILFKTRNSALIWWTQDFIEDFVYISREAARYLAEREVRTVGVDYLSVGGFHKDGVERHQALLGAGIWVIEGLDLSGVEPGEHELICLPLKVEEGDGAPARALLRR